MTGVKPLEIVECTEYGNVTGIVVSRKPSGSYYGGKLRGVLYEDYVERNEEEKTMYKAIVNTEKDPLRVREWPETGTILGSVPKGKTVDVLAEAGDGWPKIRYNELMGYASEKYLEPVTEGNSSNNSTGSEKEETVLIREDGVTIRIEGVWRIAED